MTKQIGFLGLGNMGGAMAANLVKAGFRVRGYDPAPSARERAAEAGVEVVASPAEAASGADVICSSLPEADHAYEAYLGEKGVLGAAPEGAVCFDFSTISVEGSLRLAEEAAARGVRFLDTPVSGSVPHARAGTLAIMAGGDKTALDAHRDVLAAIGKEVHHFGPNGSGLRMKLVTNHIFAIHIAAIAEGLTLGKKEGLDPARMVGFLRASAVPKILDYKAQPMIEKDYTPTFTVYLMLKDLRMIAAMAEGAKVPIPLGTLSRQVYMGAAALGHGNRDQNAIIEFFERGAGLDAVKKKDKS
ncbi:MAG: NAD(P)-dependent oxidoreductase [Candidatus Tectomicrobia bacterium]|nr:NAD(P)-dependent oxidoreductase [Candidatus Tectomicrobia bacterium]